MQNYTDGNNIWIGVPETALSKVFDFAWANMAWHLKRKHWNDTYNVLNDKARDYVNKFGDVLNNAIPKFLTLGVLSEDVTVDYLRCTASATVAWKSPGSNCYLAIPSR